MTTILISVFNILVAIIATISTKKYYSQSKIINKMNPFEVRLIETETDSMNGTLGISEERHIQLCDAIKEQVIVKKEKDITVMLSELSKICQHANELAYVSFKLSHILVKQEELINPMGLLKALMGGRY